MRISGVESSGGEARLGGRATRRQEASAERFLVSLGPCVPPNPRDILPFNRNLPKTALQECISSAVLMTYLMPLTPTL